MPIQYLAIYDNDNLPNRKNMPRNVIILQKWRNLTKLDALLPTFAWREFHYYLYSFKNVSARSPHVPKVICYCQINLLLRKKVYATCNQCDQKKIAKGL